MSEPTSHHPLPGQFRLTRLQLVNWGTFGGYKDIPIDPRGVLFTGHSGSGKSCLLDAYSLSLLPTYDQNFNASSDRTARGTKQASRTLVDYVRGAWSESNDENEQSEKRYLRGAKPTWSAVAATYEDGHGSVTTAVVVKWFTGTSNDVGSLNTTHLLHDDHLSLGHLDEWAQANFARNWFSKNYPGARYDSQTDYLREFSRRIGLGESNTAQSLLGKAKAMKNVGDLNQFIRTNMLDEPATFDAAKRMTNQFQPLEEAYNTAARAKAQFDALKDLPEHWEVYRSSEKSGSHAELLLGQPTEHYLRGVYVRLLEQELDTIDADVDRLNTQLGQLQESEHTAWEEYLSLDRQVREQSRMLDELRAQHAAAETETSRRRERFAQFSGCVTRLGEQCPQNADDFEDLRTRLPALAQQAQKDKQELGPQRNSAIANARDATDQHHSKQEELRQLQSARTLIPQHAVRRRDFISRETGIPVAELAYAAELIDMADGAERWRPAAEKVLRNYGLRLLVPEHHRDVVRRTVDANDMGGIIEYNIVPDHVAAPADPAPETLAGKLTVDVAHRCGPWLLDQLMQRFDHVCVEEAAELELHNRAVTVRGTVKLPGSHYRKDDRTELTKRSSYILGMNTASKREALQAEVEQLAEAAAEANQLADDLEDRHRNAESALAAATELQEYTSWGDLDHWESARTARDLSERIDQLVAENVDLQELEQRRDKANQEYRAAVDARTRVHQQIESTTSRQSDLADTFEQERAQPHDVSDEADRGYLDEVYAELEVTASVANMPNLRTNFRARLERHRDRANAEYKQARIHVQNIINRFIEYWPDAAPDDSGDIDRSGADFVALRAEIEQRGLPEAMKKFEHMISTDMVSSIGTLQRTIQDTTAQIKSRIKMVNEALGRVEFSPGTSLQIGYKSRSASEEQEFRSAVHEILQRAPSTGRDNPQESMRQFRRVRDLVHKFTGDDAAARQWQTAVLDVRSGYTFYGYERDAAGTVWHTYHNTGSNSGGEQEKLGAFCLAAALSYNLADTDSGGRPRFGPLMLDEAFSKSDESFAYQALAAFEEFGFQLLIAAPTRITQIVEPVIGQAVLVEKRPREHGPQSQAQSATFSEIVRRSTRKADEYALS